MTLQLCPSMYHSCAHCHRTPDLSSCPPQLGHWTLEGSYPCPNFLRPLVHETRCPYNEPGEFPEQLPWGGHSLPSQKQHVNLPSETAYERRHPGSCIHQERGNSSPGHSVTTTKGHHDSCNEDSLRHWAGSVWDRGECRQQRIGLLTWRKRTRGIGEGGWVSLCAMYTVYEFLGCQEFFRAVYTIAASFINWKRHTIKILASS